MPMEPAKEGLPTPGPSSPNTPTKGILSNSQARDGADEAEAEVDGEYEFGDLGDLGDDWDDEAQAELDAFLEDGSSDFESDAGARYVHCTLHTATVLGD